MSRAARAKGSWFQTLVLKKIARTFRLKIEEDIRTAKGYEQGTDVKLISKKARDLVGLAIECKNAKSLSIFRALDQVKKNTARGMIESVVFKKGNIGRQRTYIAVPLDHYLELRKRILNYETVEDGGSKPGGTG